MWFELRENQSVVFYLAIFSLASICAFLADKFSKTRKDGKSVLNKFFWIASFLIAWLPLAVRFYVGTDYKNYMYLYNNTSDYYNIATNSESGFWLINRFGQLFNFDFQFVISVSTLITFVLFYIGLASYRKDVNIGMATFVLLASTYSFLCNGVRQGIAMAFVFVSFKYIVDRKLVKFLIVILLGCLFHYTIICIVPFYFFSGKKDSAKWVKPIIMILFVIVLFNIQKYYSLFFNSSELFKKYSLYTVSNTHFGFGLFINIAIYLFFYFILYTNNRSNFNAVLLDILLVGSIFGYFASSIQVGARLVLYFNMTYILLCPQVTKILKQSKKKVYIFYFVAIVIIFTYLWYTSSVIRLENETIPYRATFKLF